MSGLRLLACFAHPDDEAFPVGGLLARNVAEGRRVRLVTTTLGEEGEIRQEGSATRENLGEIRRSCERTVWLQEGRIVADGPTDEVLRAYEA